MKELIGKEIVVRCDGITFKGVVVDDMKDRVLIKDKKDHVIVVVKSKIAFYMVADDSNSGLKNSGLNVIACCTLDGVDMNKYLITHKFENVYDVLCNTFELKSGTFKARDMGDLFSLSPKFLTSILSGTVYGD